MTPFSDEARAQVEAHEEAKRARARAGATPYYLATATVEGVGVGWYIRSTTRRYADDSDDVGGVVVEVYPPYVADTSTGELRDARYRCLDTAHPYPGRDPWQYLDAGEVDQRLTGLDRSGATAAGYWLLRQIPPKSRVARPHDVELLHDVWRLWAAAAQL
jgi:hypothetical protein